MTDRYNDVAASIAGMATKSFADFKLTYNKETRVWCGASPTKWSHSFYVHFSPFHITIWGDVGDATFKITDHDSLAWFIRQGAQDAHYPDYFLGKLRALEGDKRVFYVGDALAYFDEEVKRTVDEWNGCDHPGMTDEDAKQAIVDVVRGMQATHEEIKDQFEDALTNDGHPESCWANAWGSQTDSEPPSMSNWSSSALWFWHVARTFARLYTVELMK